ncbi:MAG: NB-ARC domain-containing protein [Deinococcales bacterium]
MAGKTRLAHQLALKVIAGQQFQAIYFISLKALKSFDSCFDRLAKTLHFIFVKPLSEYLSPEQKERQLLDYLREKQLLLIFDNAESFSPIAEFIYKLLRSSSKLKILVTSRHRLASRHYSELMSYEHLISLQGLSWAESQNLFHQQLEHQSQILVDTELGEDIRVNSAHSNLLSEAELEALYNIHIAVQGLPLAIKLVGRSYAHASFQIKNHLFQLQERLWPMLNQKSLNITFRTDTMLDSQLEPSSDPASRNLLEIFQNSFQLLNPDIQQGYLALALFQDSFDLKAAQSITSLNPLIFQHFVDLSLLERLPNGRYHLHNVLGYAALEALGKDPQRYEAYQASYARYYLEAVKTQQSDAILSEPALPPEDIEHYRAAWRWLLQHSEMVEVKSLLEQGQYAYALSVWDSAEHLLELAEVKLDKQLEDYAMCLLYLGLVKKRLAFVQAEPYYERALGRASVFWAWFA